MKKRLSIVLILVLLLGLLCGCGSAKMSAADSSYYQSASAESYEMKDEGASANFTGGSIAQSSAAVQPMEPNPAPSAGQSSLPENVKMIYTASIDMESTAFDSAIDVINDMVSDCGGYLENSDLNNYGSYRSIYYTIRVPAAQFAWFCDTLSALSKEGEVLHVNNISRGARDVSEAYYDIESRLATQKTKLARLQELLKQAEDMEDIITLESAISDTELAIEQLTGSLRKYDSLVGYSTIDVSLREVYKITSVEEPAIGFGAKLAAAFRSGCSRFVDNLQDFLLEFARAWVGWLIFIVIVVIVILLIVRGARRRRERAGERRRSRKERRAARKAPAEPAAPAQIPEEKSEN